MSQSSNPFQFTKLKKSVADSSDLDDSDLDDSNKSSGDGDFAKMLNESLGTPSKTARGGGKSAGLGKRFNVGDHIKAEILVVGKEEVFVALGASSEGKSQEGAVFKRDLIDAEGKFPYKTGDEISLYVTLVKSGEIRLSPNKTSKNFANDLEDAFDHMIPVEGKVLELCKGGVQVSLMGQRAFCPISQLDTKRVETGEEYIGQKFEFKITQFSEGGKNIVVSRRKLLEEQGELAGGTFLEERQDGELVTGKVMRVEPFGAFVEISAGLEGLVHVSELSWARVENASDVIEVGQVVKAKILKREMKDGKLRVSLSIKQVEGNPWDQFPEHLVVGRVVEGKVTNCMKFGAFVSLVPGIEGLIPLSEMSYTKRVMKSDELVKPGETVSVMIKELNLETKRISLSLKDAGSDPWSLVAIHFPVGTVVEGKVERRENYGLFIKLDEGIVGLLPKSKALESVDFPFDKLRVGDKVVIQVAEIKFEARQISLQPPKDGQGDDWKEFAAPSSGAGKSLGNLGSAFGAQLQKALLKKK